MGASLCSEGENKSRKEHQPVHNSLVPASRVNGKRGVGEDRPHNLQVEQGAKKETVSTSINTQNMQRDSQEHVKREELIINSERQKLKQREQAIALQRQLKEYEQKLHELQEKERINQDIISRRAKELQMQQNRLNSLKEGFEITLRQLNEEKARRQEEYHLEFSRKQREIQQIWQSSEEKYKVELQHRLRLLKEEHEQSLQSLQEEVENRRLSSHIKQQQIEQLRFKQLFQNDIFVDYQPQKQYLTTTIEQIYNNRIVRTKFLYKPDANNKVNFHKVIDNIPHLAVIVRLANGCFIAGYSQGAFAPEMVSSKDAMIISLTNRKVFRLAVANYRAISYDDYYLIFGNSELRLRTQENKVFSNFGINTSYYANRGETVNTLLGEGTTREVQLTSYEIYEIYFQNL